MRVLPLVFLLIAFDAAAAEVRLAVAANFAAPARRLAERFEQSTGRKLLLSTGSTGKFYAQIANGAPFDVFLSADAETPRRMVQEKRAVADTRFTYAIGKLVLWSPAPEVVDEHGAVLRQASFARLAIANPRLAPYGAAAQEAMQKLGVWGSVQGKLAVGENIAQTFQFVASGNATLGFVAFSQIRERGKLLPGSYWLVPQSLYSPLRQDGALLTRAAGNSAAREFLAFLRSAPAREIIASYGYDLP